MVLAKWYWSFFFYNGVFWEVEDSNSTIIFFAYHKTKYYFHSQNFIPNFFFPKWNEHFGPILNKQKGPEVHLLGRWCNHLHELLIVLDWPILCRYVSNSRQGGICTMYSVVGGMTCSAKGPKITGPNCTVVMDNWAPKWAHVALIKHFNTRLGPRPSSLSIDFLFKSLLHLLSSHLC